MDEKKIIQAAFQNDEDSRPNPDGFGLIFLNIIGILLKMILL